MLFSLYKTMKSTNAFPGSYDERLEYDKNGNILNLRRNGDLDSDSSFMYAQEMDVLGYTYKPDSNLLLSVTDDTANPKGFNDGNTQNDDFEYDNNGNMTVDLNKNIKNITYNHLNLPTKILFGNSNYITYLYTASGQKVNKVINEAGVITTTDYINGFQYKTLPSGDGGLVFFPHAEGYVNVNKSYKLTESSLYNYVFNYTDHLGNIRMSYTQAPTGALSILEENHYYPFGLKHTNYNSDKRLYVRESVASKIKPVTPLFPLVYNYKYNGKEWQDELGLNMYDYGARNYMADIGRWGSIDNKSEKYVSFSPYHYAGNNPVLYLDVDGNEFTEGAWEWVNRLIADINSRQEKNNSSIADYKAKIAGGGSDRQIARWNRNINSLTANNEELETTRGETATLAASTQVYDVVTDNGGTQKDAFGNSTTTNQTTFNSENNRVQLTVSSGTDLGLFSHELKHMYQFETGETSLGLTKNKGGSYLISGNMLFSDLSDEVQAYQRGALFGQRENINSPADVLTKEAYDSRIPSGPINAVNHPNAAGIKKDPQSFANKYNAAFRINNTTYKPQ
ncbi:RHS repeat-associated protein [Flavobacterium branchiophilum]|uniref:RHS repeat-associated protein n=2 Tax=Flavobacterium branchiophilum TaxID=55197 RepID=A0A543FZN1_9FLAO|nr:RHS repeat-associated protein [Flavobacterium branchiophilum]